jgi:transcriptional regulator with XRE-family HTH domain
LGAKERLTLRQAATKLGVTPGTLSELERGLRHPHDVTLAKIAQGYGVPVEELFEEPALAGKAEAPPQPGQSLLDRALAAARRDEDKTRQAASRAQASQGIPQAMVEYEEDKFRAELRSLGFPDEYFEDFIWPLVVTDVGLEQMREQLEQQITDMEQERTLRAGEASYENPSAEDATGAGLFNEIPEQRHTTNPLVWTAYLNELATDLEEWSFGFHKGGDPAELSEREFLAFVGGASVAGETYSRAKKTVEPKTKTWQKLGGACRG